MSRNVATIRVDAPLADAVTVMEWQRVKRLPVTLNGTLVGIISRADLVRALSAAAQEPRGAEDDHVIRSRIEDELEKQVWAKSSRVKVMVVDHVVYLYGIVESDKIKEAVELLAREDPGARTVNSHLAVRHLDAIGR
jgi:CBS domain-containing protein